MTTLHVGTFALDQLRNMTPADTVVFVDGDSWEEWGEPIAEHPGHPHHVQFVADDSTKLLADVAWFLAEGPGVLVPMTYHRQRGIIACLTPDADWSEPFHEVTDVQAKRWLQRATSAGNLAGGYDNTREWANPAWLDYLKGAQS